MKVNFIEGVDDLHKTLSEEQKAAIAKISDKTVSEIRVSLSV